MELVCFLLIAFFLFFFLSFFSLFFLSLFPSLFLSFSFSVSIHLPAERMVMPGESDSTMVIELISELAIEVGGGSLGPQEEKHKKNEGTWHAIPFFFFFFPLVPLTMKRRVNSFSPSCFFLLFLFLLLHHHHLPFPLSFVISQGGPAVHGPRGQQDGRHGHCHQDSAVTQRCEHQNQAFYQGTLNHTERRRKEKKRKINTSFIDE